MSAPRFPVLALALFAGSAWAADCRDAATPLSVDMYVAAPEMRQPLSLPGLGCTLAQDVIARARLDASAAAATVPAVGAAVPTVTSAHGYVPKTKDDNTPWRFDMNQNGRRMTSEEFDAWMKAKGIHVATGRPAATATSADAASASAPGASTP